MTLANSLTIIDMFVVILTRQAKGKTLFTAIGAARLSCNVFIGCSFYNVLTRFAPSVALILSNERHQCPEGL